MFAFPARVALLVVLSLSLLAGTLAPAVAQEATPVGVQVDGVTILPPDEPYAGVSLAEWNTRWWQWFVSFPEAVSPSFDETGERCGYGQAGPVFFLPAILIDEPVTITCVVPEGTAIIVGAGGASCSTVEPPPFFGRDEAELRACAEAATDSAVEMHVSINGEPVPNLETYRTSSPLFTLTLPEDNFYGVPPGVALAVANEYAFIVAPPPPGEYEIAGSITFDFEGELLTLEGNYRVIVLAPQVIEPGAPPDAGTPAATPGV